MKKLISLLLCAVILLTPVMSLAAPKFLTRSNTGSALQETIMLNNEYAISVPNGLFLAMTEEEDGTEGVLYLNEDVTRMFFIMALPFQTEPAEEVSKAMNQAVGQFSDKPTKALLNDSEYRRVQLPEAMAEMLGDNAELYYMNNGVYAGLQLLLLGNEGYIYAILYEGLAELEEEILAHIMTLRKF